MCPARRAARSLQEGAPGENRAMTHGAYPRRALSGPRLFGRVVLSRRLWRQRRGR
ncbi:protein of unknown function [Rhodovastum atsumiense]|nr:protein of unknown function [Rhodovastum atsumiense]